jgi:O-antigen ligase
MAKIIQIFLILIILTLPLGQLGRIPVGLENVTIYLTDVLIPLAIFTWLIFSLAIRKKIYLPPLGTLLIIFIVFVLVSLINGTRWLSETESMISSLYLIRWVGYLSLYFISWDLAKNYPSLTRYFPQLLLLTGLAVAILGFIQVILVPDFSEMAAREGWDPHQGRLLSTFFDPNFVGGFLVLAFILGVSYLLSVSDRRKKFLLSFAGILMFSAIVLTFSRSTLLSFIVGVSLIGLLKSRKILATATVVFLIATLFIPRLQERLMGAFSLDATAKARLESWERAAQVLGDNPILGIGYNSYRYAQDRHGFFEYSDLTFGGHSGAGTDSSLLLVLVTTGIVGFLVYLLLMTGLLKLAWEMKKHPLGLTLFIGTISLIIHSQFVNSLFYPQIIIWFWILAGLTIAKK